MAELRRALFGYSRASVGAVLADRELMLQRASRDAQSADERAERLAAEVMDTQRLLASAEERLREAQQLAEKLRADLDEAGAVREAKEVQLASLRTQLENVSTMLAATEETVADRDAQLRAVAEQAAAIEAEHHASLSAELNRVAELEELLADYRAELQERPLAPAPAAPPAVTPEAAAPAPVAAAPRQPAETPSTAEELAAVLLVAEQAVVRIIESTKERADEELRTVDEDRERLRREVESMIAWRDRAAPIIASLQATMDDVSSRVTDVSSRVGHALEPLTSGVLRLTTDLASLDQVPRTTFTAVNGSATDPDTRVIELHDDQFAGREAIHDTER
jgi:hypothetical protein